MNIIVPTHPIFRSLNMSRIKETYKIAEGFSQAVQEQPGGSSGVDWDSTYSENMVLRAAAHFIASLSWLASLQLI